MKIGIDIHGVADTFEIFSKISKAHFDAGHEVHIITGSKRSPEIEAQLDRLGMLYTHYFSITDELEGRGLIEWRDGRPYSTDDDAWNSAKYHYCKENGINILFDDSDTYRDYFTHPERDGTLFCHVYNPQRKKK